MTTRTCFIPLIYLLLSAWFLPGALDAQQATTPPIEPMEHKMLVPGDIEYQPGPPSLPAGSQFAVLEGDPTKEGLFTMRLKLPANYRIPPHTHPKVERVTVIEGEAKLGMGRQYDEQSMQRLAPGSFFAMPPGMEHFAGTDNGVVLQLNGIGPWEINYLDPADDPRQHNNE